MLRTICDTFPVVTPVFEAPREVIVSGTTVPDTGIFELPIIC